MVEVKIEANTNNKPILYVASALDFFIFKLYKTLLLLIIANTKEPTTSSISAKQNNPA